MSRRTRRNYTLGHFLLDAALTLLTGGIWFIWIVVREIRGL